MSPKKFILSCHICHSTSIFICKFDLPTVIIINSNIQYFVFWSKCIKKKWKYFGPCKVQPINGEWCYCCWTSSDWLSGLGTFLFHFPLPFEMDRIPWQKMLSWPLRCGETGPPETFWTGSSEKGMIGTHKPSFFPLFHPLKIPNPRCSYA